MTTILKERYNYATSKHVGDIPHFYWKSHTVPLCGYEDIQCHLILQPTGAICDKKENVGFASVFVFLEETTTAGFRGYLKATMSISIGDEKLDTTVIMGEHEEANCKFGAGWGWAREWRSADVLRKEGVEVELTLSNVKIVTETATQSQKVTPKGSKIYSYLANEEETEQKPTTEQDKDKNKRRKAADKKAPLSARRKRAKA